MIAKLFLLAAFVVVATAYEVEKIGNHGDVMEILNILQHEIQQVRNENVMLQKKVDRLEESDVAQQQLIINLKEHLLTLAAKADVDTLFLATISTGTMEISDQEPIPWDSDLINPGGHYNTITGAYTAPYDGYYQFTVTKTGNDNVGYFWLLVDENRYLFNSLSSQDITPTASVTINIQLTAGQLVRVENYVSTFLYGTDPVEGFIYSWFTGYMLYAL